MHQPAQGVAYVADTWQDTQPFLSQFLVLCTLCDAGCHDVSRHCADHTDPVGGMARFWLWHYRSLERVGDVSCGGALLSDSIFN